MKHLLILAIAMVGFTSVSFAQANASALSTAQIVATLEMTWVDDLEFGILAASNEPGTVILNPTTGIRTETGGVTLPAPESTWNMAEFYIAGEPDYAYAITLPGGGITLSNLTESMTVNTFTSSPSSTGILDVTGAAKLLVGATLHVAANQAPGFYESDVEGFEVTVNYN